MLELNILQEQIFKFLESLNALKCPSNFLVTVALIQGAAILANSCENSQWNFTSHEMLHSLSIHRLWPLYYALIFDGSIQIPSLEIIIPVFLLQCKKICTSSG
jgi:hypothetical protein